MNITTLTSVFEAIAAKIAENKDYLVELDQQNGDGDLGISMNDGYSAAAKFLKTCEHTDLGMALNKAADVFNENAPSSLGTITAFAMKGMARALKGTTDADLVTWQMHSLQVSTTLPPRLVPNVGKRLFWTHFILVRKLCY